MKISKLIKYLETLDPNLSVVLSRDAEGNSYSPLSSIDIGKYLPHNSYSGEFVDLGEEYAKDEDNDVISAVFLYPMN